MKKDTFGCHVFDGAAECVCLRALEDGLLAEAEVSELDVTNGIEQNVLGLEIAIYDALRVKVLKGKQYLGQVEAKREIC